MYGWSPVRVSDSYCRREKRKRGRRRRRERRRRKRKTEGNTKKSDGSILVS